MTNGDAQHTALISGASAGLGAEFARQLASRGCDLVLVARREARLQTLSAQLKSQFGVSAHWFAADLSDGKAPARIADFVAQRELHIDYLINNAGRSGPGLLDDTGWGAQARFLELMMLSAAQMCHRFIPAMRERGFGRVINVASFAGRLAVPAGANYGPSKAYLIALSEELALQLAGSGVNVSALCPGYVHTEFHAAGNLLDVKRASPAILWYDAPTVVAEGLRAVERGRAIHVSGRLYRFLDPLAQSVWLRPLLKAVAARSV